MVTEKTLNSLVNGYREAYGHSYENPCCGHEGDQYAVPRTDALEQLIVDCLDAHSELNMALGLNETNDWRIVGDNEPTQSDLLEEFNYICRFFYDHSIPFDLVEWTAGEQNQKLTRYLGKHARADFMAFMGFGEPEMSSYLQQIGTRRKACGLTPIVSTNPLDLLFPSNNIRGGAYNSCYCVTSTYHGSAPASVARTEGTLIAMLTKDPTARFFPVRKVGRAFMYINTKMNVLASHRLFGAFTYRQAKEAREMVQERLGGRWFRRSSGRLYVSNTSGYFDDEYTVSSTDADETALQVDMRRSLCLHCGAEHSNSCYNLCSGCYTAENLNANCPCCGEDYNDENAVWIEGEDSHYCDSCADWHTFTCNECFERYHDSDQNETATGNTVCNGCLERYFRLCDHCDEWHRAGDVNYFSNTGDICSSCRTEFAETCEHCGDVYLTEEMNHDAITGTLCDDCQETLENEANEGA